MTKNTKMTVKMTRQSILNLLQPPKKWVSTSTVIRCVNFSNFWSSRNKVTNQTRTEKRKMASHRSK